MEYLADVGQRKHNERASNKGRGLKIGHDHELAKHIEDKIKNDIVKNKTQKTVLAAIRKAKRRMGGDFSDVFKSITADNGSEFLDNEGIKRTAKCGKVYYAHPYSSWERGSNENGDRILRRFVPKGIDIGKLTAQQLQRIEDWVNNYPRRIFGYKSANEIAT